LREARAQKRDLHFGWLGLQLDLEKIA